jgi:hypothetical protein
VITVIAMKESSWLDPKYDFRQWEHLCRNYRADLIMVSGVMELGGMLMASPVVIWDEAGKTSHRDFEHPESGTYVFGKTHVNEFFHSVPHDHSVRIDTPNGKPCLFGAPAAAIALEARAAQWR